MHYCVFRRNVYSIGVYSCSQSKPSSFAVHVVLLVLQAMIAAMRTRNKVITVTVLLNCSGLSCRVENTTIFVITEVNFTCRHSTHLARSTHSVYIYFSSGRSCSYSSVGSPGGGWCTVCSHLALAEVNFSLQ